MPIKNLTLGLVLLLAAISTTALAQSQTATIKGQDVNIRRSPSTKGGVITTVDSGTRAAILSKKDGWYQLRFPKGTVGWVRGDFLNVAAKSQTVAKAPASKKSSSKTTVAQSETRTMSASQKISREQLIHEAKEFQGTRYRYGAMSRGATDCSGFTSQVFKRAGITLPRTSAQQSRTGKAVAKKDLRAGDLVFFRTTRQARVSHVGIYLGNGKFIHASSGGGKVMISSMSSGYYANRYVTGRRVGNFKSKHLAEVIQDVPEEKPVIVTNHDPEPANLTGTDEIIR